MIKDLLTTGQKNALKDLAVEIVKTPLVRFISCAKVRSMARQNPQSVKLHFGCGPRKFQGWINIDILPKIPLQDALLDLTKPLPLPDNAVDCIYTEDLIEHIPYSAAHSLMSEAFRVLKPGGIVRLGTPDLVSFSQAYLNRSERDLAWYKEHLGSETHAQMFNAGMRAWGHTFLYDEETMRHLLEPIGFLVTRTKDNESSRAEVNNLDLRSIGDSHSMFFDCVKPVSLVESSATKSREFAKV